MFTAQLLFLVRLGLDIFRRLIFERYSKIFDSSGKGKIGNMDVVCIPPEYQVQFHLGYERDVNDIKDVLKICETFNIEIPSEILKEIPHKDD